MALGIVAGYLGGWVDDVIQYLYTVLNSIPGVLLIAAAVLMMQVVIDTHPQWFETAAERATRACWPVPDPRDDQLDGPVACCAAKPSSCGSWNTCRRRGPSACRPRRILARHVLPT